jgi:ribonuclease VapC
MAYFQDEPAAEAVEAILLEAQERNNRLLMSVINAGEIWYNYARRTTAAVADERITQLRTAGVQFVEAGWELTAEASRIKSRYAIAYADCFAAALARRESAKVVTGDPEFRKIGKECAILWV